MDHLRKTLDILMGKDRDDPLFVRMTNQKHFDSPDVCKYYLLGFCPHDLFPNTKSDLGECKKRHDQQFKIKFDQDPNKEQYQQKYEEVLMDFLEMLIAEVDNKMKKCVERIEAPLPEAELSKDTQERINSIDKKISEMIAQAEHFGEIGLIDNSEQIMRTIEKLKEEKANYLSLNEHPLMFKEKQMKVCEVCGAMQSIQDNEKRLQTHVEGKLHSGYLKIREHLDLLRRRKLERKLKLDEEKQKERFQKELKEKEREVKERERGKKRRSRSREYEKKDRNYRDHDRDREKDRDHDRERTRERERSRDKNRGGRDRERRDDRGGDKYREKRKERKEYSRERRNERSNYDNDGCDRDRDRDKGYNRSRTKGY